MVCKHEFRRMTAEGRKALIAVHTVLLVAKLTELAIVIRERKLAKQKG